MMSDSCTEIKAVAFDTGGTIFDWHGALTEALTIVGTRRNLEVDWHEVANDWRRSALGNVVGRSTSQFDLNDVHRRTLDTSLARCDAGSITSDDRDELMRAWYNLKAWPDAPEAIAKIRYVYPVVSFTILPLPIVLTNSRRNCVDWDAVISCDMIGVYKPHPETYTRAAKWLGLKPSQIVMVACHTLDLQAAKQVGYKTAFVRRPAEWGPRETGGSSSNIEYDWVEDDFNELKSKLCPNDVERP